MEIVKKHTIENKKQRGFWETFLVVQQSPVISCVFAFHPKPDSCGPVFICLFALEHKYNTGFGSSVCTVISFATTNTAHKQNTFRNSISHSKQFFSKWKTFNT